MNNYLKDFQKKLKHVSMETKRVWKTFGYYALGMGDKLKSDVILTEVLKES